jgi:hypothetical protein
MERSEWLASLKAGDLVLAVCLKGRGIGRTTRWRFVAQRDGRLWVVCANEFLNRLHLAFRHRPWEHPFELNGETADGWYRLEPAEEPALTLEEAHRLADEYQEWRREMGLSECCRPLEVGPEPMSHWRLTPRAEWHRLFGGDSIWAEDAPPQPEKRVL